MKTYAFLGLLGVTALFTLVAHAPRIETAFAGEAHDDANPRKETGPFLDARSASRVSTLGSRLVIEPQASDTDGVKQEMPNERYFAIHAAMKNISLTDTESARLSRLMKEFPETGEAFAKLYALKKLDGSFSLEEKKRAAQVLVRELAEEADETQRLLQKIVGTSGFDAEALAVRATGYAAAGLMDLVEPEAEAAAWKDLEWSIARGSDRDRHAVGADALLALGHSANVGLDARLRERLNNDHCALVALDPSVADELD